MAASNTPVKSNTAAATAGTMDKDRQRFEQLASEAVPSSDTPVSDMTAEQRILATRAQGQGLTSNLGEGRLPSTTAMTAALDKVNLQDQTSGLSTDGQRVVGRLDELADTTKQVLKEKNAHDQLQKTVYHATRAGATTASSGRAGDVRGVAGEHLSSSADVARQLSAKVTDVARLTVTSSAFRRLLGDLTNMFQEVVTDRVQDPDMVNNQASTGNYSNDPATHQSTLTTGTPSNLNAPAGTDLPRTGESAPYVSRLDPATAQQQGTSGLNPGFHHSQQQQQQPLPGQHDVPLDPFQQPNHTHDTGLNQAQFQQPSSTLTGDHTYQSNLDATSAAGTTGRELTTEEARREAGNTLRDARQPAIKMGMDAAAPYAKNIRDGHAGVRETARQAVGDLARNTLQGLPNARMTPEQRETLIGRFKELMREVQTHPDYQRAIEELLDLLTELRTHLTEMSRHTQQHGREHADENPDLKRSVANARQLIENFANGYSTRALYGAIRQFLTDVSNDERATAVQRDNKQFVLKCLRDHTYLESDQYRTDARGLLERNRDTFQAHSQAASETIGHELRQLMDGFRRDPVTRQWTDSLGGLFSDLFLDEQGKPTFKTNLVHDAVKVLPELVAAARYVPLPRIESADDQFEFAVDNTVISLSNILPNNVTISTRTDIDFGNYGKDLTGTVEQHAHRAREHAHEKTGTGAAPGMKLDPRATSATARSSASSSESSTDSEPENADRNAKTKAERKADRRTRRTRRRSNSGDLSHTVAFDIRNVVCTAHNVVFYFKKKTGFPKLSDAGYADLEMNENKGLDLHVVVRVGNQESPDRALRVVKVETRLRSLKLNLHGTKHDVMYKMLGPIINSSVRRRVQKALNQSIRDFVAQVDTRMVQTARVARAQAVQSGGALRDSARSTGQTVGQKGAALRESTRSVGQTAAEKSAALRGRVAGAGKTTSDREHHDSALTSPNQGSRPTDFATPGHHHQDPLSPTSTNLAGSHQAVRDLNSEGHSSVATSGSDFSSPHHHHPQTSDLAHPQSSVLRDHTPATAVNPMAPHSTGLNTKVDEFHTPAEEAFDPLHDQNTRTAALGPQSDFQQGGAHGHAQRQL
ncbi:hypothetical protein IWQ60_005024 [Tieghemiomyces parasiticus]|uniref:Uncharacterized protein n=1 Tax=Tieghemiomyces parasiticus TaxID=78921 RepID=A0A9W8AEU5_9FUNG|nr:hypothetical protein IWQ60_005024 [Tieghemiomyces parasiticus]